VKRKDSTKESRDAIFFVHDQKYRRGLVLNPDNISGTGDDACFALPFRSPNDSAASPALRRLFAYLKVTDLSKLSFNIDEMTGVPETVAVSRSEHRFQVSPFGSSEGLPCFALPCIHSPEQPSSSVVVMSPYFKPILDEVFKSSCHLQLAIVTVAVIHSTFVS
jgi:hypothetical protein